MDSQTGPLETNVDVDSFFRSYILGPQVISVLNFLLYGAYVVLFGICLNILLQRRKRFNSDGHNFAWCFQLVTMVVLFGLATASTILDGMQALADLVFRFSLVAGNGQELVIDKLITLMKLRSPYIDAVFVISNALADALLIQRCYIVWGHKRRVVFFPIILSLGSTGYALYLVSLAVPNTKLVRTVIEELPVNEAKAAAANEFLDIAPLLVTVFLAINIFSNVLLTGLIAGRIWWIRRSVDKLIGSVSPNSGMYRTAIAIFLESGLSYPVALAITFGFQPHYNQLLGCTLLNQIVGIAPTLIIVRTGLGLSVQSVHETMETLRCVLGSGGRYQSGSSNVPSVPRPTTIVSFRAKDTVLSDVSDFGTRRDRPTMSERSGEQDIETKNYGEDIV